MAVATYKPASQTRPSPIQNVVAKDESSIAVDNQYVPITSITQYVSGYSWTVDYYSQVVNKHTDLRDHDYSQNAIYQQYNKINQFVMKVTSPLESTQDTTTNEVLVTGSATVHPYIIPNTGDMFLADLGQGIYGVFRVTAVERKSYHLDSVYDISYSLLYHRDDSLKRFEDLESKVTHRYFYHKDFVSSGQNPLLIEEECVSITDLSGHYDYILDQYIGRFYSNQFSTLVVPGQLASTYDRYVTEYLLSITDLSEHPDLKKIRRLNIDKEAFIDQPTIFTALKSRDMTPIKRAVKSMTLVSTAGFNATAVLDGIRYSGIKYLVYPDTSKDTMVRTFSAPKASVGSIEIASSNNYPHIYPVNLDGFYVLSSHFYEQTPNQSNLETMIRDYLVGASIDHFKLTELIGVMEDFTDIEYYYYVPLILTLIKATLQSY